MKIFITGASGFIGSALIPLLTTNGHELIKLKRTKPTACKGELFWDPNKEIIDTSKLEGADAVVHLSGERLDTRWTKRKKAKLRDSRVKTTHFISKTLSELENPPKVLVKAAGIGYYGDRGAEIQTEESKPDSSFLAKLCLDWEAATEPAHKKGIRVVNLRLGLVLSPSGGSLKKMLLPFKMGMGGCIGSGEQYWSWVSLNDVIGAFYRALITDSLTGPVNVVAPNAVTNREFTKTLGRILARPTFFSMPGAAARLIFGEMAEALVLASTRVTPIKLLESGYQFHHTTLEDALRQMLVS